MKIESPIQSFSVSQGRQDFFKKEVMATGTGLSIEDKVEVRSDIKKNDPQDPLVSKKILDSLNLGFINFTQDERDTLDLILNKKRAEL